MQDFIQRFNHNKILELKQNFHLNKCKEFIHLIINNDNQQIYYPWH